MPDRGQCCEVECNDNGWQLIPKSLTSCGIAGYSYFADICNQGCEIVDDTSKCRSSAYSSDCTAEPECNGKSPGDVLPDLCSWSELKVLRKCSSTCSIEVTYTYVCDKNHCGEWRYCGGKNYQCIYDGGWLWSANPPSNFCCNDNWCSGYDPNSHTKIVCDCPSPSCTFSPKVNDYTCKALTKCEKNEDCAPDWCCTADPALGADKESPGSCSYSSANPIYKNKYICDPPSWNSEESS
ncbi:MAG: hypothetical protein QXH67_06020 [Candidatus Bathyarchaeia archaeon]